MTEEAQRALEKAAQARMKHASGSAHNLIVMIDKIKNGNAPVSDFAALRGLVAKLTQEIHEASAYYSAFSTVRDAKEFIPMSRPGVKKKSPDYMRRRRKSISTQNEASQ